MRRQKVPQDNQFVNPNGEILPPWLYYLGSVQGLSGADQIAPIADMTGAETLGQTITKINDILAALRTAGILRTT